MEERVTGLFHIQALYVLAFNILIFFYHLLGDNLGIAIIVFTLVLKFLTLPFSLRQIKSAKKNRKFQEKYKQIQNKYKNATGKKKEKMTKELASLQAEYLPGQLGGCLPMILQLAFFFQVYYVLTNLLQRGTQAFNEVAYEFIPKFSQGAEINLDFFGINLGKSPSDIGLDNFSAVWPYLLLVLLVGAAQFLNSRIISGLNAIPGKKDQKREKSIKKNKKKKSQEIEQDLSFGDALAEASKNTLYIFPVITMAISLGLPSGLALYWTVSSGFAIIQQLIINKDKVIEKINVLKNKLKNNK